MTNAKIWISKILPLCQVLQIGSHAVYWESFTENIHEFSGFGNDCECFLANILYPLIILTQNVHCRKSLPFDCTILIYQT